MPLTEELKTKSIEKLTRMLHLLGYDVSAQFAEQQEQPCISIKTDEPGRIIGRKGHSLQSTELLLNRMLRSESPDCPWVEVDVDGYEKKGRKRGRKPRQDVDEQKLEKIARNTAKEVKRWGQPKRIGPLNAAERRIIHMALREDPEVETESEEADTEGQKRVVVRLA